MNATLPVNPVGLGQPREFEAPATAANTPVDLTGQTQLVREDFDAPNRLHITRGIPVRYVPVKTRMGIEQVAVVDKQKRFCVTDADFRARASSICVRTREVDKDGRMFEVCGKVLVVDAKGEMLARFDSPAQAVEHFKRLGFDYARLPGGARLNEPAERPARPRRKKGQHTVEELAATAVAAVMAAQKGLSTPPEPKRKGKKDEED